MTICNAIHGYVFCHTNYYVKVSVLVLPYLRSFSLLYCTSRVLLLCPAIHHVFIARLLSSSSSAVLHIVCSSASCVFILTAASARRWCRLPTQPTPHNPQPPTPPTPIIQITYGVEWHCFISKGLLLKAVQMVFDLRCNVYHVLCFLFCISCSVYPLLCILYCVSCSTSLQTIWICTM